MEIEFYIVTDKPNVINKTVVNGVLMQGSVSEFSELQTPKIFVRNYQNVFNYCKVFNRYYFIENVVLKKNNESEISLECDYLFTFKEYILNSKGLVIKSENPNTYISNRDVVTDIRPKINDYYLPNNPFLNDLQIILLTQK